MGVSGETGPDFFIFFCGGVGFEVLSVSVEDDITPGAAGWGGVGLSQRSKSMSEWLCVFVRMYNSAQGLFSPTTWSERSENKLSVV